MGFTHYAACYPIDQAAADVAFADFREDLRRLKNQDYKYLSLLELYAVSVKSN